MQELLKEVMDSSFISAKTKEEYCSRLGELVERHTARLAPPPQELIAKVSAETIAKYRERTTWMVSAMMGTLTALMTALFALFQEKQSLPTEQVPEGIEILIRRAPVLLPALLSILAAVLSLWFVMLGREVTHRREQLRDSDVDRGEAQPKVDDKKQGT